jgi:KDO2-lipid IV(A) lauroyltransferase
MLPAHLAPRTWPAWAGIGLFRLVALLPYGPAMRVGAGLGRLVYPFLPARKKSVADTNLRLCFPELDEGARRALAREHARRMGMGAVEIAVSWWWPSERLRALGSVHGIEHLLTPHAQGRGVILLSAHFTSLEIGGHLLGLEAPVQVIYRRNPNPALEFVTRRGRERHAAGVMHRDDIKPMIRSLRRGGIVWFAPDQNYRQKNRVFAPFFGIAAATNPATARLAAMTGAAVVPFSTIRRPDCRGYDVRIEPALEDFPTGDAVSDATRINAVFERWAREQPADYYWFHRRFKTRPPDEPPIYH